MLASTIFLGQSSCKKVKDQMRLNVKVYLQDYTALIWQKEASDKSDISRKRAKCVCHLH